MGYRTADSEKRASRLKLWSLRRLNLFVSVVLCITSIFEKEKSRLGNMNSQGLDGHIHCFLFQSQGRRDPGQKIHLSGLDDLVGLLLQFMSMFARREIWARGPKLKRLG